MYLDVYMLTSQDRNTRELMYIYTLAYLYTDKKVVKSHIHSARTGATSWRRPCDTILYEVHMHEFLMFVLPTFFHFIELKISSLIHIAKI